MAAIFQPLPGLPAGGGQYRQAFPDGVVQRPVKIAFPFVAGDPIKSYTYTTHPLLQKTVYGPSQTVFPPTGQPGSRPERYVRPFDKRDHPYPIMPMPNTANSRGPPPFVARNAETVRSVGVGTNIVSAVAPQPTLPAVDLPAPDPNFATRQPVGPSTLESITQVVSGTGRYLADSLAGAHSYFESQLPEDADEVDEDEIQQKQFLTRNEAERKRALARVQALQAAEEDRAYRRLHGQLLSEHEKKEEREERRETNRLLRELNGNLSRRPAPEAEPEVFYEAQAGGPSGADSGSEAESFDEDTYVPARRGRQRVYARTPGTRPQVKRPIVPGFRPDGGQPRRQQPQPFVPLATPDPVINTLAVPVVPGEELRRQRIREEIVRRQELQAMAGLRNPVSQDDFIRSYTAPAEPEPELAGPANRAVFNPFFTQPKREAPILAGPSTVGGITGLATTTETDEPAPPEPQPLGVWGTVPPPPKKPTSPPTSPGFLASTEASRARQSPRARVSTAPAYTGPIPEVELLTVADLKKELNKLDVYAGLSRLNKAQLQDLLAKTRRQRGIKS